MTTERATTTAARRIAEGVIEALTAVPQVRALSLFGSLATATDDAYSDVDLMVGYGPDGGGPDGEAEQAIAAAIRAWRPVLFFRTFTGVEQPSGRYWFEGESLFSQLDAGLYAMPEYQRVRVEGVREGYPVTSKEVLRRGLAPEAPSSGAAYEPRTIDERERGIGGAVYTLRHHAASHLRGRLPLGDFRVATEAFERECADVERDTVMAGGAIGELVHACREIAAEGLEASAAGGGTR